MQLSPFLAAFGLIGNPAVDRQSGGPPEETRAIERALRLVTFVMVTGIVAVVVMALGQQGFAAGVRFFLIGLLTAIAAAALGGLAGLVFGLPGSGGSAVSPAAPPASADTGDGTSAPPAANADWFVDNSALGQISTWLTGAIIALSLTNFNGWTDRFDRAAAAIDREMASAPAAERVVLSASVVAADTALRRARAGLAAIDAARGKALAADAAPAAGSAAARAAAAGAVAAGETRLTAALAAQRAPDGIAVAGLLLAGYAMLGFFGSYLWTRRYLPAELARGRGDMRAEQDRIEQRARRVTVAARSEGNVQAAPRGPNDGGTASSQAAEAREQAPAPLGTEEGVQPVREVIRPGTVANDPWKGQFGGSPTSASLTASATVTVATGVTGLFAIDLRVAALNTARPSPLAGRQLRLYLHPTFPSAIRIVTMGPDGEVRVPLLGYGGFTVGVELLGSDELLELDLALLPGVPQLFRER